MTERLQDITARIEGIRQLGAVVNAMRGIAGVRTQQARGQLAAVDGYSAILDAAIGRVLGLIPSGLSAPGGKPGRLGIVVFCAEQGFAGAFSERVLDALGPEAGDADIFIAGSRGIQAAAERGLAPAWTGALPSHSTGIPKFADRIAEVLYQRIATGAIDRLQVVFGRWSAGRMMSVETRRLLPLDERSFQRRSELNPPILYLPPTAVLDRLAADYVQAELCKAALHGFAAENEARMQSMAKAHREIEHRLAELQERQRIVRQNEITAEIIELASGELAARATD